MAKTATEIMEEKIKEYETKIEEKIRKLDPKAIAIWADEGVAYGTLTFCRDAIGRWTPIITRYYYVKPCSNVLGELDKSARCERDEIWLNDPFDKSDMEAVTKWNTEVNKLLAVFWELSESEYPSHNLSWYDAAYFNGGESLQMMLTPLQQQLIFRRDPHYRERLKKIYEREANERKADMLDWLDEADANYMKSLGIEIPDL